MALPSEKGNKILGYYYLLTGIWPIMHMDSFIFVTGYKHDLWLVDMVGLLTISIGIFLIIRFHALLAGMTVLSFMAIDIIYVGNDTISTIYLVDAGIQFIFLVWILLRTWHLHYKKRNISEPHLTR